MDRTRGKMNQDEECKRKSERKREREKKYTSLLCILIAKQDVIDSGISGIREKLLSAIAI